MGLADWLRGYGQAATEAERPEVKVAPGGQRFIAFEDMTPRQLALAHLQQGVRAGTQRTSVFSADPNPESMPTPPPGNAGSPYRDLAGRWLDGRTDQPLSPVEQDRWGVA